MLLPIAIGVTIGIVIAVGAIVFMLESERFEMGLADYP